MHPLSGSPLDAVNICLAMMKKILMPGKCQFVMVDASDQPDNVEDEEKGGLKNEAEGRIRMSLYKKVFNTYCILKLSHIFQIATSQCLYWFIIH